MVPTHILQRGDNIPNHKTWPKNVSKQIRPKQRNDYFLFTRSHTRQFITLPPVLKSNLKPPKNTIYNSLMLGSRVVAYRRSKKQNPHGEQITSQEDMQCPRPPSRFTPPCWQARSSGQIPAVHLLSSHNRLPNGSGSEAVQPPYRTRIVD